MFSLEGPRGVMERGGRYRTQNGLAWSSSGRTMYVSDSHRTNPHVMAYDFDCDSGEVSNGRLFADQTGLLGGRRMALPWMPMTATGSPLPILAGCYA